MNSEIKLLIQDLIKAKIIKFGEFTLKSGDVSPFYIDLRLIPSYPELFNRTIKLFVNKIQEISIDFDHLAGLISAGVPFATGICLSLNKSLLQIRSTAKGHGRTRMVEGMYSPGETVLILDDLISTGASKIPAIHALSELDMLTTGIMVLIDRRKTDEINTKLEGMPVHSVFTILDILNVIQSADSEDRFLDGIDIPELQSSLNLWLENKN